MADNRKINHGVWVDGELITDADVLAKAKLSPERLSQLEEAGSIEGFSKKSDDAAPKGKKKE